jgi:glyoxylase-like metal-dependent hydrolase (beta-lactamase superfamily II)
MNRFFFFLAFLFLSIPYSYAQRDWSQMHIETTELAPNIYRLFVGESVAVVVFTGPEGVLVIDAAYEQTTDQLMEAIRQLSPEPVRYLVNTHLHGDHTGGNTVVGKDAVIISHHSVKEWLASDRRRGGAAPGPAPLYAQPDITFEGDMNMYFNDAEIWLGHKPEAHTRGDLVVYFEYANVLVLGDLLFADYFPFVDVSQGGNPHGLVKHLNWVKDSYPENTVLVGGHGPVHSMAELRDYLVQLEASIEAIRTAKSSGLGPDEMKAKRILGQWESFGKYFITEDRWIDIVYPFVE